MEANSFICDHNMLVLKRWPDACIDAVVTDPPYGLKFMGKSWDHDVPKAALWWEVLRVLKPGGHLLSFFGTRTYHRGVCAIEDAGFEIRDQIGWAYGSGFPKSLDVSKAIDKEAGAKREVIGTIRRWGANASGGRGNQRANGYQPSNPGAEKFDNVTSPTTAEAQQWSGWGTALKPAWESIVLARKPLEGTVASNVLKHGTGGMNVDGCRIGNERRMNSAAGNKPGGNSLNMSKVGMPQGAPGKAATGRWPANLIHDGSPEVLACFPQAGKESAARYFYCAKASRAERDAGCEQVEKGEASIYAQDEWSKTHMTNNHEPVHNNHPTVKPLALMRYLCRLITPPGGLVLDPFCGSGSTCIAAMQEGFSWLGIDRDAHSIEIAEARMTYWETQRRK